MADRDLRPLSELRFANHILDDVQEPRAREMVEASIKNTLEHCGVVVAQDIIDLGCTGFFKQSAKYIDDPLIVLAMVQHILQNIGGAGTGLPCYVSPNKFCLVHNCVGALEPGQTGSVAHKGMVRDLTDEECKHARTVQAVAEQHAVDELKENFAAEVMDDESRIKDYCVDLASIKMQPICSDHPKTPSLDCRACVAVAILEQVHTDGSNVISTSQDVGGGITEHYYLAFTTRIEFLK